MKKTFLSVALMFAGVISSLPVAEAQTPAQPAAPAPSGSQSAPATPQQQKKEIKDPAEYNAYVGAVQQQDPNAKISGLEAFLTQYPNSVMKEDALELLMASYQQTGNPAKMGDTAKRLLAINPNNVRALALLCYTARTQAQANQNLQQNLADAKTYCTKGIDALQSFQKPDGMSDADFQKLKTQMNTIFNSGAGIAALQDKDYPTALAFLQQNPPDYDNGVWYAARASTIAPNPQYQQQIEKYAKSQYVKYHGGEDGWTDVLAQAKANPTQPAGFKLKPAPTPAEQAAALVKDKTPEQIKALSFAEWELVLSKGSPDDAAKVWDAIKGVSLQMEGQVISATADQIQIAASSDDIDKKTADITLTMNGPIPARLMPKVDSTLDFEGTPASYTPKPFMMTMEKGQLLTKAAPTRKAPVHRKPGQ